MHPEQMTTSHVDGVTEMPQPTFATAAPLPSANSVFTGYDCGEDCDQHALDHKGDFLDACGWDGDDIDG